MKEFSPVFLMSIILVIVVIIIIFKSKERFDIPTCKSLKNDLYCPGGVPPFKRIPDSCESSAWGWNTGPGYGAGYGTGYGLYGEWPANVPSRPWKPWMWGRRPSTFVGRETPMPQIDYDINLRK